MFNPGQLCVGPDGSLFRVLQATDCPMVLVKKIATGKEEWQSARFFEHETTAIPGQIAAEQLAGILARFVETYSDLLDKHAKELQAHARTKERLFQLMEIELRDWKIS